MSMQSEPRRRASCGNYPFNRRVRLTWTTFCAEMPFWMLLYSGIWNTATMSAFIWLAPPVGVTDGHKENHQGRWITNERPGTGCSGGTSAPSGAERIVKWK